MQSIANDANAHPLSQNEIFARRRLKRFGWEMIILALSMGLYYLGFFNTVEGPLNTHRVGAFLAENGITVTHLILFLVAVFVISVSWNWMLNLSRRRSSGSGVDQTGEVRATGKGIWGHTLWIAVLLLLAGVIGYAQLFKG